MVTSDKQIARLAFSVLRSPAVSADGSADGGKQQDDLQSALAAALAHHPEDSSYVECLLDIGMAGHGTRLPVHDTVQSVARSGCLHVGILQVRKNVSNRFGIYACSCSTVSDAFVASSYPVCMRLALPLQMYESVRQGDHSAHIHDLQVLQKVMHGDPCVLVELSTSLCRLKAERSLAVSAALSCWTSLRPKAGAVQSSSIKQPYGVPCCRQ